MIEIVFFRAREGNIEQTHIKLADLLGIFVTSVEQKFNHDAQKKKKTDYERNNYKEGKRKCRVTSLLEAH